MVLLTTRLHLRALPLLLPALARWMPLSYSALQPLVPNLKELHVMLQGSPELEAAAGV